MLAAQDRGQHRRYRRHDGLAKVGENLYVILESTIIKERYMSKTPDVFHAIADPNRRRLLAMMMTREHAVSELHSQFDMTVGAVSQHLKVLREAGLVRRRSAGRQRLYMAAPVALKEVHDWTEQFSKFWNSRLDRLGEVLDSEP